MIEPPKPSRVDFAYSMMLGLCLLGFVASVLTVVLISLIWGRSSDRLYFVATWSSAGIFLFPGIYFFSWRLEKREQRRRDEHAFRLFDAARSGEIATFAIFLRPFYTTRKIKTIVSSRIYIGNPMSGTMAITTYHLEETLIKALPMPVVALGKRGKVYGAGRIPMSKDSWESAASVLMCNASMIICMPSDHPGVKWELDEILRNQHLGKTVFLMPRDPSRLRSKWKALRNDWNAVVAHMETHGFRIPPYEQEGLLFAIRPTIGCFIEDFDLTSSEKLGGAIERLSSPKPSSKRFEEKQPTPSFDAGWRAALKRAFGRSSNVMGEQSSERGP